jgi:hypothetical protein
MCKLVSLKGPCRYWTPDEYYGRQGVLLAGGLR